MPESKQRDYALSLNCQRKEMEEYNWCYLDGDREHQCQWIYICWFDTQSNSRYDSTSE